MRSFRIIFNIAVFCFWSLFGAEAAVLQYNELNQQCEWADSVRSGFKIVQCARAKGLPLNKISDSENKKRPPHLFLRALVPLGLSQTISLTVLFCSSKEKTKWEHNFGPELFRYVGSNLHKAWTSAPVLDKDPFLTNYIQHPYGGSVYYNLMRSQGCTRAVSFGMSVFGSTFFEYVTEAMFERPSIQDLVVTPVVGSLLGEVVHQITIKLVSRNFNIPKKVVVLIINPAYIWNHGFKARRAGSSGFSNVAGDQRSGTVW